MAHSDSEDSNNAVSKSKSKSKPDPVKGDAESEHEEGSEAGSEYEIEEVLDAKRGYFPDGRMGYYVRWKGYGPEDNSWVDETDAGNAEDLVNEFWKKNPMKKKGAAAGRKSVDKKTPKKGRKSAATDDTPDAEETSTKKRGRKSVSERVESEDEMDVDEPVEKPAKKARKNSTQPPKANAKKNKTATPEPQDKPIGNMKSYMHLQEWEGLIKTVDTVERQGKKLIVFFTLQTGEAVKEYSDVCKDRFPRKLIEFYESNLRWRQADEVDSS